MGETQGAYKELKARNRALHDFYGPWPYKFQMISLREPQFIEQKLGKLECSVNQGDHNSRTKRGKVRNQTWPGFYRLWPCVWISNNLPDGMISIKWTHTGRKWNRVEPKMEGYKHFLVLFCLSFKESQMKAPLAVI